MNALFNKRLCRVALLLGTALIPQTALGNSVNSDAERKFISAIDNISNSRIDEALVQFSELTREAPKFSLAKLIYADLLASRSGIVRAIGDDSLLAADKLKALKEEALARVKYHQQNAIDDNKLPKDLVQMTPDMPYAIMVDINQSRLYLFANKNGEPKLIRDYYASSGKAGADKYVKGDNKTPLGVYFITGRIPASKLPSKYGAGALPLNYPNSLDLQMNKTGNGIWLHGSPVETYSRPPQASEGCVSLTNIDFTELDALVNIKTTPVVIGRNLKWVDKVQWRKQQLEFNQLIKDWEADWESREAQKYITYYSPDFKTHKDDFTSWTTRRARANAQKAYININISNLSLFTYPDEPGMLVASFSQEYQSDNYQGKEFKRQYWRKEGSAWKVVYEGLPSKGNP